MAEHVRTRQISTATLMIYISAIGLFLFVIPGCARISCEKVIHTYRGGFIGEERVNKVVETYSPSLKSIVLAKEDGVISVHVEQKQRLLFDIANRYHKIHIVRLVSSASRRGKFMNTPIGFAATILSHDRKVIKEGFNWRHALVNFRTF